MNKTWYRAIIVLLVVLNALLIYRMRSTQISNNIDIVNPDIYLKRTSVPDVAVIENDNSRMNLLELVQNNPFTILVFFSPSDCPTCFSEKKLWEQIHEKTGMPVYGIASHPSADELWQWIEVAEIPIKVYLDTSFAIEDAMEFQRTPLKVLVDSIGNVIWADPFRDIGRPTEKYWKEVEYVIGKYYE